MLAIKLVAASLVFALIVAAWAGTVVLITHIAMNALDYGEEDEQSNR